MHQSVNFVIVPVRILGMISPNVFGTPIVNRIDVVNFINNFCRPTFIFESFFVVYRYCTETVETFIGTNADESCCRLILSVPFGE